MVVNRVSRQLGTGGRALQFQRGDASQPARHSGDDQVGALDIRAPVCVVRGHAGGQWRAWGSSSWLWIVVAMVSARSAAMAFNRLADASIDAANPRTQTRALPAGALTPGFVSTFVVVSCAVFVFAASQLNRLSLLLSPVALAVLLLYSYTKRFTRWSHLVLGFAHGDGAVGSVDCGAGSARSTDSVADCRGYVLGCGLRCAVRVSGLRFRPAKRAALCPALLRDWPGHCGSREAFMWPCWCCW